MKTTLLSAMLVVLGFMSQATTIIVTNTNDSGPGSLREASVNAVNGDTIRFDPGLLTAAVDSISLNTEIDFLNKQVVIKGLYNDTDTLFISGGNTSRIFHFSAPGEVYLDSLVLINGNGSGVLNGNGGAILFSGLNDTAYVKNSVIRDNHVTSSGGGIFCYGAKPGLCLDNVTISNNSAPGNGGGMYMAPNQVSENHLIINNSTISGNSANRGAGIYTLAENTSITITSSTIVNNAAATSVGGVELSAGTSGVVTLENSTVAFNQAPSDAGIYLVAGSNPIMNTRNSIIIENGSGQSGISGNLSLNSNGYNIFSDNIPAVPSVMTTATDLLNQSSANVNLSPLGMNGGTTPTMKPLPGSVAIDMGDPLDGSPAQNGLISGVRDIGAAEGCIATVSSFSVTECFAYTVPSGNSTYTAAGTYTVHDTISNAEGCDSIMSIELTIFSLDTSTTTSGLTITSNAVGASYQWIDCGNNNMAISGETNASYTATVNGDYAVVVTDGNCSDTSECVSITTIGIEDYLSIANTVTIYPSPATNVLTIEADNLNVNMITIVSATGQTVKTCSTSTNTIDVSDLASGIYFLQIQTNDKGMVSKRFVKR